MDDITEHVERQFTTGVALITTSGPLGDNVMAAEWTMQVSYEPFLIATFVSLQEATHGQIEASGEFGVNVCSDEQLAHAALAGGYTRRDVDKLSSELFEISPAKYIKAPLIRGCVVNAECRLHAQFLVGDHTAFVGQVVAATYDETKRPMIRRGQGFYQLGPRIERPRVAYIAVAGDARGPGSVVRVVGRVFDPPSDGVQIAVQEPSGNRRILATVETNPRGVFSGEVQLPDDLSPLPLILLALAGDRVGRARLSAGQTPDRSARPA
ncbi:MAG: flavin reductase family protein [bacterium]